MDTQSYIINDLKPFDSNDTLRQVKNAFNQLTFSHIPVSEEGIFIGCISETDAHCFDSDKTLNDYRYAVEPFFVRVTTNWLDILEAFAQKGSNIMPVLDEKGSYVGYYELSDIMDLFNHTPFLNETGGIIVVEKGSHDYSFSEICQIVESNDGKVLGAFISNIENDITQTTIKIGHSGMNSIAQTFRRYGYNVVSEHEEDKMNDELKERSDYLNKYLNI
ncbi:CBS domain-containing protein [Aureisphaera sp. CAU 1614]|uniref:CBS domain-containing protein n=1 Tax=Halomarinibacterium sedimenti TaxID=2857106 RepID=A0A9X1K125_9FLAO|nr:CBS domain-containing protein [Halomarinibacterium sedimenti]MAL59356.1 acetoin utilization protein acuB [Flavobacteriaceae bacterium]MBW2939046.1 CBS domain-containing protein [Halomarinibacterium sedimenti]HAT63078.1 acetoin utilization protein acuB [Flavobacteriaceae bacterium]